MLILQISDFYKSSSMSAEQILQQYGTPQPQGTMCGRGKRLEELTKRAQELARQPGPQQQARQVPPGGMEGRYGIPVSQPGYIAKEEMGRQRISNLEEQYGANNPPYDYALDRSNFEDRKPLSPTQRTSPRVGKPTGGGNVSLDTIDDIDLPPGVPTHLPPPPFMGPLDHLKLGGGYSSDMGR